MHVYFQQIQYDICVRPDEMHQVSMTLELGIDPGDGDIHQLQALQRAMVERDPTMLLLTLLQAHTGDVYVKREPVVVPDQLVPVRHPRTGRALDLEEGQ